MLERMLILRPIYEEPSAALANNQPRSRYRQSVRMLPTNTGEYLTLGFFVLWRLDKRNKRTQYQSQRTKSNTRKGLLKLPALDTSTILPLIPLALTYK